MFNRSKRSKKALKRIFGILNIDEAKLFLYEIQKGLEKRVNKNICEFTHNDIKSNGYLYSKYKLLNKLISQIGE